jgi:repressor LexA
VNKALIDSGSGARLVANLERGSMPSAEKLTLLANYLQVDTDYLIGNTNNPRSFDPTDWIEKHKIEAIKLPIYGVVRCGVGGIAEKELLGYELVSTSDIKGKGECYWLRVEGDSMQPKIEAGDLVLVQETPSVDSGKYAVVIVDDEEGVVKQVKYGDGWLELHSENARYPVRQFLKEGMKRVRIVGLVLRISRPLL